MAGPTKGADDYLELGDWNATCSMCGHKRKASQMVKNWQGMWRCPEHNEPRHPQDFVRAVPDIQTPPWTQPEPANVFAPVCFPLDTCGIADFAVADCAICDYVSPLVLPEDIPQVITIFLTSGNSWTLPPDAGTELFIVECVGGGGGGSQNSIGAGGGGGGAYSKNDTLVLAGTLNYGIGAGGARGGDGGDTWFGGTVATPSVMAKGGVHGGLSGGAGGAAASGVGLVKYSGGHGGAATGLGASGGGGGAAGRAGNGAAGGTDSGSNAGGGGGGANAGTAGVSSGTGGVPGGGHGGFTSTMGAAGTGDASFDSAHGAGGGGGGGGSTTFYTDGGNGGVYGGGGGGSGASSGSSNTGLGGQGLIVITYVRDPATP